MPKVAEGKASEPAEERAPELTQKEEPASQREKPRSWASPQLTEGEGRFWTASFGGVTALSLVVGGLFAVVQYFSSRETAMNTASIQASTAFFEAKKTFYARQLELCELASSQAAILATPAVHTSA